MAKNKASVELTAKFTIFLIYISLLYNYHYNFNSHQNLPCLRSGEKMYGGYLDKS